LVVALIGLALSACSGTQAPSFTPTPAGSDEPTPEQTVPGATDTASPIPGAAEVDFARLAMGETPDGWVEVLSRDGHCRQAVPNDWLTDVIVGFGDSPDLHVQSMVADDLVPQWNTWPEYIVALKNTYFTALSSSSMVVLVEDDELYLMRETAHGGGSYVISRNNHDATACGILLTVDEAFKDQWAATAVQILYTLAMTETSPSPSP
jgi:hypothetical protein